MELRLLHGLHLHGPLLHGPLLHGLLLHGLLLHGLLLHGLLPHLAESRRVERFDLVVSERLCAALGRADRLRGATISRPALCVLALCVLNESGECLSQLSVRNNLVDPHAGGAAERARCADGVARGVLDERLGDEVIRDGAAAAWEHHGLAKERLRDWAP